MLSTEIGSVTRCEETFTWTLGKATTLPGELSTVPFHGPLWPKGEDVIISHKEVKVYG